MHLIHRQTCRVCGSRNLTRVIDLGEQRLQGTFIRHSARTLPARKVPCRLVRCDPVKDEIACGLLQMEHTVPPEILYDLYWYRSGTNQTMNDHLAGVVKEAVGMFEVVNRRAGSTVLDIGCNDGTLLSNYPKRWRKVGVDPAEIERGTQKNTLIIRSLFPSSEFDRKCSLRSLERFDIITSIAMFYDLEEPMNFVREIGARLATPGLWILEVSYLPSMLKQNSYDTICSEHLEYYSLSTLEGIITRAGLEVVRAELNDCNGGSIRCYVSKPGSPWSRHIEWQAALKELRQEEFNLKLDTDEPYLQFQQRVNDHRARLLSVLEDIKRLNKTVHAYGASTKGNTILQFCGIKSDLVQYAADRNPEKWGMFTPGSDIPIISEEESRKMKPDYYLVLPWHFRKEFLRREEAMLKAGTQFIFPLPTLEVLGHDGYLCS